jgi:hypothetical protein
LELSNQFHGLKYRGFTEIPQEGRRQFLRRLNPTVSLPKH